MKRALLTGASGFLGRYLEASLHARAVEVLPAGRENIGEVADAKCWRALLQKTRPDAIFHLLGKTAGNDEAEFDAAHVAPTNALLRAASILRLGQVPIFILGSAAEYGKVAPERQPISESEPASPVSPYGRSKLRATEIAQQFAAQGLRTVVVRLFNVFGKGMSPALMPGSLLAQLQDDSPAIRLGPLDRVRDFLRADVAMEALAQLGFTSVPGGTILNLCSGHGFRLDEIVRTILSAAGRSGDLVQDKSDSARSEGVLHCVGNPEKISTLLGFRPAPPTLQDFAALVR